MLKTKQVIPDADVSVLSALKNGSMMVTLSAVICGWGCLIRKQFGRNNPGRLGIKRINQQRDCEKEISRIVKAFKELEMHHTISACQSMHALVF